MTRFVIVLACCLAAAPAMAQSAYVAGDIGADISRVSHSESSVLSTSSGSEVLSGELRVGTSIGSGWGVELGFVRSGRDHSSAPFAVPLNTSQLTPTLQGLGLDPTLLFPRGVTIDVRHRRSSFDTVLWARQHSSRVDLVYLGGVSFGRDRSDVSQNFGPVAGIAIPARFDSSTITYSTRPLVGMEARIALASKMRLIPGLRLQGIGGGWLVRPYVGLGWFF